MPGFPAWPAPEVTQALALSPTLFPILGAILLFLITIIAALLLFSVATRIRRERRQRRRDRFDARWEPVLFGRTLGDAVPLPPLARSERLLFLALWLRVQGYVRGEAAGVLAQTARELRLPQYALHLLDARAPWKRMIGMQSVAALRLAEARGNLLAKIMQDRPRSSLLAARALLQIDPERGLAGLAHLLNHLEWSPSAVAGTVQAGDGRAGPMLAAQVRAARPGRAKQLMRLIGLLKDQVALPALRERLLSNRDEEEIAAILYCFGKFGETEDRLATLAFLKHAKWVVRLQAAHALGFLGTVDDVDRLLPLVRDRHWWVRYRAAQSLRGLAGAAALAGMRDRESDPYAREMLERVLAEGR